MKTIRFLSKSSSIGSLARTKSASPPLTIKWMSLSSIRRTSSPLQTLANLITSTSNSMRRTLCWCQMKLMKSSRLIRFTNLSNFRHKKNSPLSKLKETSFQIACRRCSTRIHSIRNGRNNKEVLVLNTNVSWDIEGEKRGLVVEENFEGHYLLTIKQHFL